VAALGVEEQRVNVIVDFANRAEAGNLGDGYRVEVRIVTWRVDSTLKVNVGSLFRRGEEWAVFAIDNGRARLQPVKVGQRNDREGQVLEGLSEGQLIALHPPDTLQDGARIKLRGQTP
jgi:HlyD family secretion protein